MHKKALLLVLSGMLSFTLLTGCENQVTNKATKQTELVGTKINGEMGEIVEEEKPKYNFDEHNILTFEEIEVNNTPDYKGDKYIDFKCKVTNNSEQMIKNVDVNFSLYDKDNVLLDSKSAWDDTTIPSGNSFYVDSSFDSTEYKVNEIKIDSYSYYIGDVYYKVDLMAKSIEVWD